MVTSQDIAFEANLISKGRILITAFEGWNDASGAAINSIDHLIAIWQGVKIDEIDADPYFDFQVTRPEIKLNSQGRREIIWPKTTIYSCDTVAGQSVFLLKGHEPSFNWVDYCREILGLCLELEIDTIWSLGSLLADVPHTRTIPVNSTSLSPAIREEFGFDESDYEGPVGILNVLQDLAQRADFNTVSTWAAHPHYATVSPNPKTTLGLVEHISDLLGVDINTLNLELQTQQWEENVSKLVEQDEEISQYIAVLEKKIDDYRLKQASGESIAREFERYLRRKDN